MREKYSTKTIFLATVVVFVINGLLLYHLKSPPPLDRGQGQERVETQLVETSPEENPLFYHNAMTTVYEKKTKQKFIISTDDETVQVRKILSVREDLDWRKWVGKSYWQYQSQKERIPNRLDGTFGRWSKIAMGYGKRDTANFDATEEEIIEGMAKYCIDNRLGDAPANPTLINGNELGMNIDPSILTRDCNTNFPNSTVQGGLLKLFGDCLYPPKSEESPTIVFVTYEDRFKHSKRLKEYFVNKLKLVHQENFHHFTRDDAEPWFVAANWDAMKHSGGFGYWHWRYYFISRVLRKYPYSTSTIVFFVRPDVKLPSISEVKKFFQEKVEMKQDIDFPSDGGGIVYDILNIDMIKKFQFEDSEHEWPFVVFRNTFLSRIFLGYVLRYHMYSEKRC